MSRGARIGTGIGIVAGTAGVVTSGLGNQEHGAGNVVGGALSGAAAGASVGSLIAPGLGTAIGAGVGALAGALYPAAKVFSETDCLRDPVTGAYTCCNTAFNKGDRVVPIGGFMFCGAEDGSQNTPFQVRQCLQGKPKDESTWTDQGKKWYEGGMWVDDFWAPECTVRFCNTAPAQGIENYIIPVQDTTNFCWDWQCIDGYERSGDTCVIAGGGGNGTTGGAPVTPYTNPTNPTADQYDELIKRLQLQRQLILQECGYMVNTQNQN